MMAAHRPSLLLQLQLLLLVTAAAAAAGAKERRQLGHRGRHRHRQPDDAGVVFDKTTIPYCNFPNRAAIPPLAEGLVGRTPGLRLLQVQVVARHGSRTPYKVYDPTCWSGYGFVWNCNVTEMTQAGSTDGGVDGDPAPWIFRKIYDGSPTVLGGTCHLGQLVQEGFEQEIDNGKALAAAYIGPGPLKLFANTHLGAVKAEHLYLRSDDDPSYRTEMSGEFLVRGMFASGAPVTLLWHTGDFELDELYPNDRVCPALRDVERAAWESREWAQVEGSGWVRHLNKRMAEELPGYDWQHMLDCLGTTSCTDRPFPSTLSRATFDDAMAYSSMRKAFPFHWNEAYFSKLAMGPLAKTLLDNLQARAANPRQDPLRFALFLAHDTTVLPLLCAWDVWDGAWPSYAALLAIELYESTQHGPLVRLVYAGQELILPGCTEALCPLATFSALTAPWAFATDDPARPCGSGAAASDGDNNGQQQQRGGRRSFAAAPPKTKAEAVMAAAGAGAAPAPRTPAAEVGSAVSATATHAPRGAYIQQEPQTPAVGQSSDAPSSSSSSSSSSSFGTLVLGTLLGVGIGVALTLAWGRRLRRREYVGLEGDAGTTGNAGAVGYFPGAFDGTGGGAGGIPHTVLSAVDRGRYASI